MTPAMKILTAIIVAMGIAIMVALALVAYGIGNFIRFNKADTNRWHFAGISVAPVDETPANWATFESILSADDSRLALVDEDLNTSSYANLSYKYTLQIYDEVSDRVVDFDPKIINRTPAVTN